MWKRKKILKKTAAVLCAAASLVTGVCAVQVYADESHLSTGYLYADRTYVPVRTVYERFGAQVSWDAPSRSARITTPDGQVYTVAEGRWGISFDGGHIPADTANQLSEGRLCAPVRAVAQSLGCSVSWNGSAALLQSNSPLPGTDTVPDTDSESDEDDAFYWLARIIHAEAQGESMEGMIAVGNTILNRVASSLYPDTVYGVIFDRKYAVQYEPVRNGSIYNTPSQDACTAARRCLAGENVVGDCLFFLNPRKASNFWIVNNRDFYRSIGNHDFYL